MDVFRTALQIKGKEKKVFQDYSLVSTASGMIAEEPLQYSKEVRLGLKSPEEPIKGISAGKVDDFVECTNTKGK